MLWWHTSLRWTCQQLLVPYTSRGTPQQIALQDSHALIITYMYIIWYWYLSSELALQYWMVCQWPFPIVYEAPGVQVVNQLSYFTTLLRIGPLWCCHWVRIGVQVHVAGVKCGAETSMVNGTKYLPTNPLWQWSVMLVLRICCQWCALCRILCWYSSLDQEIRFGIQRECNCHYS